MRALQLKGIGELQLVEIGVPEIGDDQLLVKTGAALICTSDLNDIRENPLGIKLPVIMGHEGAGTVVKVGKDAEGFEVGDRVAAHPVHPCGTCQNCRSDMGHLCSAMGHFGVNMQGTFAEYFVVRTDRARVLPSNIPFAVGALTEPICVCLEALVQAKLPQGGTLLITGDGPFGVLIARLARATPLEKIVIAGHHDFRLSLAQGATPVNTKKTPHPAAALQAHADGYGYDAVILAVGTPKAAQEGLALLKPKGRLVVFSAIPGDTPIDLLSVHIRELEIVGACNDQDRLDEAVEKLSDGSLELDKLVTHTFPVRAYREAFRLVERGHEEAMKVALTFEEE